MTAIARRSASRDARFSLVAMALALFFAAACSASVEPAATHVVPATDQQFLPPMSIQMTAGSGGLEGSAIDIARSWWWLISPVSTITASNNRSNTTHFSVTTTVGAPPCNTPVRLAIQYDHRQLTVRVAPGGQLPLKFDLSIPPYSVDQVRVAVETAACHITGDSRPLYAQLAALQITS